MAKLVAFPGTTFEWDYSQEYDYDDYVAAEKKWLDGLVNQVKAANPSDKYAGVVMQFGVADGYATYIVVKSKPLCLAHLHDGDGYMIPAAHIRGLNISDVKQQIKWNELWSK